MDFFVQKKTPPNEGRGRIKKISKKKSRKKSGFFGGIFLDGRSEYFYSLHIHAEFSVANPLLKEKKNKLYFQ